MNYGLFVAKKRDHAAGPNYIIKTKSKIVGFYDHTETFHGL